MQSAKDLNGMTIREFIYENERPNPMTLVFIIFITILFFMALSRYMSNPDISGVWIDQKNGEHMIIHDKYRNIITVDGTYLGVIKDNTISIPKHQLHAVIRRGMIIWNNGEMWMRNISLA